MGAEPVGSGTPEPPPGRWQPAIREIETDHDALGRVFFERDDEMEVELESCKAFGLFFLDVETSSVEGWISDAPILPSPGNRFVYLSSEVAPVLYDRAAGRSYTWDAGEVSLVPERPEVQTWHRRLRTFTDGLLGWGTDPDERLVFRSGSRYAVVNASFEAVAWFDLTDAVSPLRWWVHPDGTHLLMRTVSEDEPDERLYVIDLSDGSRATVRVPRQHAYASYSQIRVSGSGIVVSSFIPDSGRVSLAHYDWALALQSSLLLPFGELSHDGSLLAAVTLSTAVYDLAVAPGLSITSIFDAVTGVELIRIKGALPAQTFFGVHGGRSHWLLDGSGLVVDTRDGSGIVRMDDPRVSLFRAEKDWWNDTLIPSPDRVDRLDRPFQYYLAYCGQADGNDSQGVQCRVLSARVVRDTGHELTSARVTLRILPGSVWDVQPGSVDAVAWNRTSWGLTSDELRMHLSLSGPYESGGARPLLPLVVDRPPFTALTALEVDTNEDCVNLRTAPEPEASILECIPARSVVNSVEPPAGMTYGDYAYPLARIFFGRFGGTLAYVRTEDGVDGWLPLDSLKWAE